MPRSCPLCHQTKTEKHTFSFEEWHVGKCVACGMIYLLNPPDQVELSGSFAWEHTKISERMKRRKDRKFYYLVVSDSIKKIRDTLRRGERNDVTLINKLAPHGGNLLDVGCGPGKSLKLLERTNNWQLYGIEPSPSLAAAANEICERTGGRALQAVAVDGFKQQGENQLDVVLMRSFLEHDSEAEATLKSALYSLKKSGFALIKVPNAACWNAKLRGNSWPGVRHPDHVNYFTPQTLKSFVLNAGFSSIYFPLHWRLPTSDSLWMVARK